MIIFMHVTWHKNQNVARWLINVNLEECPTRSIHVIWDLGCRMIDLHGMLTPFNVKNFGTCKCTSAYFRQEPMTNSLVKKLAELLCIQGCTHEDDLEWVGRILCLALSVICRWGISLLNNLFEVGYQDICP